jgi:putative SOS response-associated peptidase YedK
MCGRYTLKTGAEELTSFLQATLAVDASGLGHSPRFNVAPTQSAPVVLNRAPPLPANLRWGLVPSWAESPAVGSRLINARAETLATSPAFRAALRRRRCLVLADGFFEWRRAGRVREPIYLSLADGRPFALAGLWEYWRDSEGQGLSTFTIVTVAANAFVAPIHNRMPAILPPADWPQWLEPAEVAPDVVAPLCRPAPADWLRAWPVSPLVNSPRQDGPGCVEALPTLFGPGNAGQP